jgi:predicted O-linked N-acetylglucosamine transferase (SPINDLY family)
MASLTGLLADATARAAAGDRAGALADYREAVALAPERAELWHNLGALHAALGDRDAALAAFAEAARRHPDWAEPWHARGHLLFAAGDIEGARAAFDAAVARDPDHLAARMNLATACVRLARYSAALPHLEHARRLAPADAAVWWALRVDLLRLRRDEDALADFLRFEPYARADGRTVAAALATALRMGDAAREARALDAALAQPYVAGESAALAEVLALAQYCDVAPERLLALYRAYDALVRAELAVAGDDAPLAPAAPRRRPPGDERIRVGYVSADFRAHVMGRTLLPVLLAHDRARFDVRLYSLAPEANEDALTAQFRAGCDGFARLAGAADADAARAIAGDDLDLLVDLMGHSAFGRPGILARKPARVVATHLGHHGALGLAAVDYKISDAVADAPDAARWQIEAVLPLPVCVLPLRAYRAPAPHWSRDELGIASDAVVCAQFVSAQKLSPRCLALWRALLAQVPRAVLVFSPQRDDDRAALARRLAGHGVDAARVRYVPYDGEWLHERYALADLALDTLPYTGGDTTAAALAAGVPVVTREGARHAERMTASILRHAGLESLVAASDDAYVALAARLAADDGWRELQRTAVRTALSRPSLADPNLYAFALEQAYRRALTEKRLHPA